VSPSSVTGFSPYAPPLLYDCMHIDIIVEHHGLRNSISDYAHQQQPCFSGSRFACFPFYFSGAIRMQITDELLAPSTKIHYNKLLKKLCRCGWDTPQKIREDIPGIRNFLSEISNKTIDFNSGRARVRNFISAIYYVIDERPLDLKDFMRINYHVYDSKVASGSYLQNVETFIVSGI